MFLLTIRRSGPQWDASRPMEEQSDWAAHAAFMDGLVDAGFIVLGGPLSDEHRVVHAVEAESEDEIRATLARDPWSETHLSHRHDRAVDDQARRATLTTGFGSEATLQGSWRGSGSAPADPDPGCALNGSGGGRIRTSVG